MRRDWLGVVSALFLGCGTPTTPDAGVLDDAGTDAGTPADAGSLVGSFQLLHTVSSFGDSASFFGKAFDGPTPATLLWTVDLTDGDCRVETPRVPFCATPCGGSAACVADDTCQAYPTSRNLGTLRLTGARVGADGGSVMAFDMTPINNGYQPLATTMLAVPPFDDGAALTLSATGSSVAPAFTLSTTAVAPIALTQTGYTLAPNSPLELQWAPGSSATAARIEVEVDISHHGGIKGQILCDTADDGSLTIGAGLATRLIGLGVSGFPTIVVRRVKAASSGALVFKATSSTELSLSIPGLVSCTDDSECPMGQTCQVDLRCQ